MFTAIHLQNFKVHVDTRVPLSPFTLLVGPNSVGKSSVLQALASLVDRKTIRTDHRHLPGNSEMRVAVTTNGEEGGLAVAPANPPGSSFQPRAQPEGSWEHWGTCLELALDPKNVAKTSPNRALMDVTGLGCASVLAGLKLADDPAFEEIRKRLSQVVPSLTGIAIRYMGYENGIHLRFMDGAEVPAQEASEGTLLALGLITLLHTSQRPTLLLIDDLERGLHPKAQLELLAVLRAIQAQDPSLQIVATTHSPYVVDAMEPKEVVAFARDEKGVIQARSLAEHPALQGEDALLLTAGQLWALRDEAEWVKAAAP